MAVSTPELTLLADAASVVADVPIEEREALHDDLVAFLREELDPQRQRDCAWTIAQIAAADPGEGERLQELLLRLCLLLSD